MRGQITGKIPRIDYTAYLNSDVKRSTKKYKGFERKEIENRPPTTYSNETRDQLINRILNQ